MFEVIVTHREKLREQIMGRFQTECEALNAARQMAYQNTDLIVRAWVRAVREAKSPN